MRFHRHVGAGLVLGALAVLPGCFDSDDSLTSATTDTEQEAIQYVALEEEASLADPDVMLWEEPDADAAPIATLRWWRQLLDLHKTFDIVIEEPEGEPATAHVTVICEASGILHLAACGDLETELVHVEKPFEDTGVRSMLIRRERPVDGRHRGWRLVALSGVSIESPETSRKIESVRIEAGDVDETITGVTDLVRVHDLLTLPPGVRAKITVSTGDASDQVFLHLRRARMRLELESNGDGTFSREFFTGEELGPRHLVVDVLSEGTLFDDEAPYDNVAWGIPCRVGRIGPA
jgi:hypothetical protein